MPKTKSAAEPARLYLMTPPVADAALFLPQLEAAIGAADVACVLVSLAARDEGSAKKIVRALAPAIQSRQSALLLAGDATLAARVDADGVHLRGEGQALLDRLEDAIASLKPERIVGAGGPYSKHDAMTTGELDVDYIMFGDPGAGGRPPSPEEVLQRISWWAEIFTVPCVGYAHELADVGPLAAAGADFIALGDAIWNDPRGPAVAMRDAEAAMISAVRLGIE